MDPMWSPKPRMSCHNDTCACHPQAPPVRGYESGGTFVTLDFLAHGGRY